MSDHLKHCACPSCQAWNHWYKAVDVGRFNIFTDIEIGHLYAVLKPGRMLAEVTEEIERRRKHYESMPCEHGYSDFNNCGKCRTPQETP